ncbi:MAG: phosphohistidine phosphatase SixA [Candidatus Zixiibacteriota bacterium]|nr:MAG: phosphohistidine phosphatase SixA [candidate division Zixibacteria bacterium]
MQSRRRYYRSGLSATNLLKADRKSCQQCLIVLSSNLDTRGLCHSRGGSKVYLYLVQHAEAKTEQEDPARPLSLAGLDSIEKTARLLSEEVRPSVNTIFHSGKTRARQTAEILADHVNPSGGVKEAEGLQPGADPSIWAERLTGTADNVMLVGHLPHLGRLASLLLSGDQTKSLVNFHNAGIVCLVALEPGAWSIEWAIVPGLCG